MSDADTSCGKVPVEEKDLVNITRGSMVELKQLEQFFPQCETGFLKAVLEAYSYDVQGSVGYIEEELAKDKNSEEAMKARDKLRKSKLRLEYKRAVSDLAPGLYIIPRFEDGCDRISRRDFTHWDGVIFIRRGFYRGGIFKFSIEIPERYPHILPKIIFHTKLYHVLVNPVSGILDLQPRFPSSREEDGKRIEMTHFCQYIKDIFFLPQLWERSKSPANKAVLAAWLSYLGGESEMNIEFLENVKMCVERSLACRYEKPSEFSITFEEISDDTYCNINRKLKIFDDERRQLEPDLKKGDFWSLLKS